MIHRVTATSKSNVIVKVELSIYVVEFPRRGMHPLTGTWEVSSIEEIAQLISQSQICLRLFRKLCVSGAVKRVHLWQSTSFTREAPTHKVENKGTISTKSSRFSTICTNDGLPAGASFQHINITSRTMPGAESGH